MKSNDLFLFIGDSITDCGRLDDSEEMGYGYVRNIRDHMWLEYPNQNLLFCNKGVGGDRIIDLEARWEKDVIDLAPTYVTISIGINDVWRQLDSPDAEQVYPDKFESIYNKLLTKVKAKTKAKIFLMEPTIIAERANSEGNQKLVPYIEIIHRLANTFQAVIVPQHQTFLAILEQKPPYKLTTDGVHMTSTGNILMAKTWIETFSSKYKSNI